MDLCREHISDCFSFVTKSDLWKKELWSGHGAMVTGGSPATGSKASLWWQIPHFSSETKRREMPNFTHALQKAFFFPLRLPCRSKMPCSNPWMLSDNNCIFNSSWADNPKAELMRGSCFRSSTRLGWRPHFRALSCKAQSCPSHWVSSSPWASPLPLWAACGDDG